MTEPTPYEPSHRARMLEKVLTEARARTLWGESPESLRHWLLGHEAEISEALADELIRLCRRERSLTLRRAGIRDLILGCVLLAGGGAALVVCVLRIDAGAGTPEFAGAVASAVPAVIGLLLVLRGLERVVFGAQVEGEANDTVFWD